MLKSDKAKEIRVEPDESSDDTLLVRLASIHSIATVDIVYLHHFLRNPKFSSIQHRTVRIIDSCFPELELWK